MAKGDDARTRNLITQGNDFSGTLGQQTRENILDPNYRATRDNYNNAVERQGQDYSNIMSGYGNFAQTGGYSPQNIADIRARSVNPLRSVYAGANREVDRSRALQGGYSPGYGVLKARMARDMGQGISDANTNINANIAQMVNQGKLAGLGGMASTYSATPGLVGTYGNQMLNASGQILNSDEMRMRQQLGLIGQQNQLNQAPGKWEHALGRINEVFNLGGKVGTTLGMF